MSADRNRTALSQAVELELQKVIADFSGWKYQSLRGQMQKALATFERFRVNNEKINIDDFLRSLLMACEVSKSKKNFLKIIQHLLELELIGIGELAIVINLLKEQAQSSDDESVHASILQIVQRISSTKSWLNEFVAELVLQVFFVLDSTTKSSIVYSVTRGSLIQLTEQFVENASTDYLARYDRYDSTNNIAKNNGSTHQNGSTSSASSVTDRNSSVTNSSSRNADISSSNGNEGSKKLSYPPAGQTALDDHGALDKIEPTIGLSINGTIYDFTFSHMKTRDPDPKDSHSSALRVLFLYVQDLCVMADLDKGIDYTNLTNVVLNYNAGIESKCHQQKEQEFRLRPGTRSGSWLLSVRWNRVSCFELLETAVRANPELFFRNRDLFCLVKQQICPVILKNLLAVKPEASGDFPVMVRCCLLVEVLIKNAIPPLYDELSYILSFMTDVILHSGNNFPRWQQCIYLEFVLSLVKDPDCLVILKHLYYHKRRNQKTANEKGSITTAKDASDAIVSTSSSKDHQQSLVETCFLVYLIEKQGPTLQKGPIHKLEDYRENLLKQKSMLEFSMTQNQTEMHSNPLEAGNADNGGCSNNSKAFLSDTSSTIVGTSIIGGMGSNQQLQQIHNVVNIINAGNNAGSHYLNNVGSHVNATTKIGDFSYLCNKYLSIEILLNFTKSLYEAMCKTVPEDKRKLIPFRFSLPLTPEQEEVCGLLKSAWSHLCAGLNSLFLNRHNCSQSLAAFAGIKSTVDEGERWRFITRLYKHLEHLLALMGAFNLSDGISVMLRKTAASCLAIEWVIPPSNIADSDSNKSSPSDDLMMISGTSSYNRKNCNDGPADIKKPLLLAANTQAVVSSTSANLALLAFVDPVNLSKCKGYVELSVGFGALFSQKHWNLWLTNVMRMFKEYTKAEKDQKLYQKFISLPQTLKDLHEGSGQGGGFSNHGSFASGGGAPLWQSHHGPGQNSSSGFGGVSGSQISGAVGGMVSGVSTTVVGVMSGETQRKRGEWTDAIVQSKTEFTKTFNQVFNQASLTFADDAISALFMALLERIHETIKELEALTGANRNFRPSLLDSRQGSERSSEGGLERRGSGGSIGGTSGRGGAGGGHSIFISNAMKKADQGHPQTHSKREILVASLISEGHDDDLPTSMQDSSARRDGSITPREFIAKNPEADQQLILLTEAYITMVRVNAYRISKLTCVESEELSSFININSSIVVNNSIAEQASSNVSKDTALKIRNDRQANNVSVDRQASERADMLLMEMVIKKFFDSIHLTSDKNLQKKLLSHLAETISTALVASWKKPNPNLSSPKSRTNSPSLILSPDSTSLLGREVSSVQSTSRNISQNSDETNRTSLMDQEGKREFDWLKPLETLSENSEMRGFCCEALATVLGTAGDDLSTQSWSRVIEFLTSTTKKEMHQRNLKCYSLVSFSKVLEAPVKLTLKEINTIFQERETRSVLPESDCMPILFRVIETIVQDFRSKVSKLDPKLAVVLIQTLGAFARCTHSSVNVSFTALKHLWHTADILGERLLWSYIESTDDSLTEGEAPQSAAAPQLGAMELFRQMQVSCLDPRREVRDCALKSLTGALCGFSLLDDLDDSNAIGIQVSGGEMSGRFIDTSDPGYKSENDPHDKFKVNLERKQEGIRNLIDLMLSTCTKLVDVYLTCGSEEVEEKRNVNLHHTINTQRKQWGETVGQAVGGMRRVLAHFAPQVNGGNASQVQSPTTRNNTSADENINNASTDENTRHWIRTSITFIGVLWRCISPPWGAGGFDITQPRDSKFYFVGSDSDQDYIDSHGRTANYCVRALADLLSLPASSLTMDEACDANPESGNSPINTAEYKADKSPLILAAIKLAPSRVSPWLSGWGLLWRLTKAFLTQPVLPESLADGVLYCLQTMGPALHLKTKKEYDLQIQARERENAKINRLLTKKGHCEEEGHCGEKIVELAEEIIICHRVCWSLYGALASVPSLYVTTAIPWHPISQSTIRSPPEITDVKDPSCNLPTLKDIEHIFPEDVSHLWLWQPSLRGSLNLYTQKQQSCDDNCILERENKFIPLEEWLCPPDTPHTQMVRNWSTYHHRRTLPHPLNSIISILDTMSIVPDKEVMRKFVRFFGSIFVDLRAMSADSQKPILTIRIIFLLVGYVRQGLKLGMEIGRGSTNNSSGPLSGSTMASMASQDSQVGSVGSPQRAGMRSSFQKSDIVDIDEVKSSPTESKNSKSSSVRQQAGDKNDSCKPLSETEENHILHLVSDILHHIIPYIILELLKPTWQYGNQRQLKSSNYETERHDVGLWKPAIESSIYLMEDAFHIILHLNKNKSWYKKRRLFVTNVFYDTCLKFISSLNFKSTPLLDCAKIYFMGHRLFGFLIDQSSPLLSKLMYYFDAEIGDNSGEYSDVPDENEVDTLLKSPYDKTTGCAGMNVLFDLIQGPPVQGSEGMSSSTSSSFCCQKMVDIKLSSKEKSSQQQQVENLEVGTSLECWSTKQIRIPEKFQWDNITDDEIGKEALKKEVKNILTSRLEKIMNGYALYHKQLEGWKERKAAREKNGKDISSLVISRQNSSNLLQSGVGSRKNSAANILADKDCEEPILNPRLKSQLHHMISRMKRGTDLDLLVKCFPMLTQCIMYCDEPELREDLTLVFERLVPWVRMKDQMQESSNSIQKSNSDGTIMKNSSSASSMGSPSQFQGNSGQVQGERPRQSSGMSLTNSSNRAAGCGRFGMSPTNNSGNRVNQTTQNMNTVNNAQASVCNNVQRQTSPKSGTVPATNSNAVRGMVGGVTDSVPAGSAGTKYTATIGAATVPPTGSVVTVPPAIAVATAGTAGATLVSTPKTYTTPANGVVSNGNAGTTAAAVPTRLKVASVPQMSAEDGI